MPPTQKLTFDISPTKSMTPLSWSMAEYITLLASNYNGKVMDQPDIVKERYLTVSAKF